MSGTPYAAKLKAPFAVLGIRTADGEVTGIEYLPRTERAQAPADAVAAQAVRELERYLADPHHRFTLPLAPRGHRRSSAASGMRSPRFPSANREPTARSRGRCARRRARSARPAARTRSPWSCRAIAWSAAMGALGGFMNAEDGDPIAVKRWLLEHEGYRFGA